MAGYFYVDSQGFFKTSSSKELEVDGWILVSARPPDLNHRWDFDKLQWLKIEGNEVAMASGDEMTVQQATALNDTEASTQDLRSQNIISLTSSDNLNIGNNAGDWDDLDILYYKSVNPKFKDGGVYITSRGFLAFPNLSWDSSIESKTTSFVFFVQADSRYFLLGLGSRERFNFNSNSYTQCEIGLRFRNSYGVYYQHGLGSTYAGTSHQSLTAYQGYENLGRNNYFRLDIPNNGQRGETALLYLLKNGDRQNWLGGELIQNYPLFLTPDRSGTTLFPVLGDYTGSKHQLLGVLTR